MKWALRYVGGNRNSMAAAAHKGVQAHAGPPVGLYRSGKSRDSKGCRRSPEITRGAACSRHRRGVPTTREKPMSDWLPSPRNTGPGRLLWHEGEGECCYRTLTLRQCDWHSRCRWGGAAHLAPAAMSSSARPAYKRCHAVGRDAVLHHGGLGRKAVDRGTHGWGLGGVLRPRTPWRSTASRPTAWQR